MNTIEQYCREIGMLLGDPAAEALEGIRQEAREAFGEREPAWEELVERLGSPEDAAEALADGVKQESRRRMAARRWKYAAVVVGVILLCALAVAIYLRQSGDGGYAVIVTSQYDVGEGPDIESGEHIVRYHYDE